MQKSFRFLLGLTLVLSMFLSIGIAAPEVVQGQEQSQAIFRIGYLGSPNDDFARGVELTISQINDSGGTIAFDNRVYTYDMVYAEIETADDVAVAINDLVLQQVVVIFGPTDDAIAINSAADLSASPVPVITTATTDNLFTGDVNNNIFRAVAPDAVYGTALANYMVNVLEITDILLVQEGAENLVHANNFQTTLELVHGINPSRVVEGEDVATLDTQTSQILSNNPQAIVMFGGEDIALEMIDSLRGLNWQGKIIMYNAFDKLGSSDHDPELTAGIIGVDSWTFGARTETGSAFVAQFVERYGVVPSPHGVAGYDTFWGLDRVLRNYDSEGETVRQGLAELANFNLVHGPLNTAGYEDNNISMTAYIYELTGRGGTARLAIYDNGILRDGSVVAPATDPTAVVIDDDTNPTATVLPTDVPASTAGTATATSTPSVLTAVILIPRLNVRTGPSTAYEVISQLEEGDQVPIAGHEGSYSWFLVQANGRLGWISAEFVSIFDPGGLVATLPVIPAPSTPTPAPVITTVPTSPPSAEADLVITGVTYSPTFVEPSCPFTATVNVTNQGGANAGTFAVATTFIPSDSSTFMGTNLGGLAVGASTTAGLTQTIGYTAYVPSLAYVVDLNDEVNEGGNENNNEFTAAFKVDKPSHVQTTISITSGSSVDLFGGTPDLTWDGTTLTMLNSGKLGAFISETFDMVHYDQVPPVAIAPSIANPQPNSVLGLVTAEGLKGVMRIDTVSGGSITLTYRVYKNKSFCQP